ncbi:DUF5134 domain-containing protein [Planosporangium sp. 12N6]|uniref:DUF5134 domain-containing protein n=1 Tax=Planosporangium spinosum TaxID=3402278 RepID=UPI003CE997D6
MIGSPALRWTLVTVFTLTGAYCSARCLLPAGGDRVTLADRLTALTHLAMSLVMVAMLWSWRWGGWRDVSLAVFAAAACWFGVRTAAAVAGGAPAGDCLELAQHGVTMAAMVWMVLLVPTGVAPAPHPGAHPMAGMAMPVAGVTSVPDPLPAGDVTAVNVVAGTYFLLAALWWLARAGRRSWVVASPAVPMGPVAAGGAAPARGRLLTSGTGLALHALMSAGTGVMLVAMS